MKKGFFHSLSVTLLTTISLLVSLSVLAQSTVVSDFQSNENTGGFLKPNKTFGSPYSSNRLKGSSRRKFTPRNRKDVRLKSKFPRSLGIANYDVVWHVKSLNGRKKQRVRGKVASVSLNPGRYLVTMKVGSYTETKRISVRKSRNAVQSFYMPIKAGLLKVNTGSKTASLGNASIDVRDKNGKLVASSKGKSIRRLLKSGQYIISYRYGQKKGRNAVRITNGMVEEANLKLPVSGKVWIRAFESNNQPLMKRSVWIITDEKGKTVKTTKRHNLRLSLFPGTYTAHLTVAGKKKSKIFKVTSGGRNDVELRL